MYSNSLESILRHFLSLYKDAACFCDLEGLTPLLRAARSGFLRASKLILEYCPESVDVYDLKGRTVLHYAHFSDYKYLQELLKIPEINALMNVKDCEGNTAAHLATKNGNFLLLKILHESMANFSLKNYKDISVEELIEPHGGFFSDVEKAMANTTTGKWMEKK
ncbi:hypothetical protein BVRB_9g216130 [Beta vulgaris subsp. vulgaris]|nr:hypothetical protein BVRB_9g216130 [Beta vulgaris subsp. vulgaris]